MLFGKVQPVIFFTVLDGKYLEGSSFKIYSGGYFNQVAFIYFTITLLNKPLNGYVRQRNRSGDDMSKIGKATILEFKTTIATFSIKFENVSPA